MERKFAKKGFFGHINYISTMGLLNDVLCYSQRLFIDSCITEVKDGDLCFMMASQSPIHRAITDFTDFTIRGFLIALLF